MKRAAPSAVIIAAGITAALCIGKLPPALPVLRESLQITLVQAGLLLSLVQLAGVLLGLAMGLLADGIGHKRSMVTGLLVLCVAGTLGGFTADVHTLLALRALEGVGLLLACMPGPALIRQVVVPARLGAVLGVWGACMPLAVAIAVLLGPFAVSAGGWQGWWWLLAAAAGAMAAWVAHAVPADPAHPPGPLRVPGPGAIERLRATLGAPGLGLIATAFFLYSSQWLAVIGFLPTIYAQAGVAAEVAGALTALAAAANVVGSIASGRLLQRGVPPQRLLHVGFGLMGAGALLAFGPLAGASGWLAAPVRYAGVLLFSAAGGLIPATLFFLAVKLAPGERAVSTTVGWMQQWSSLGHLAGPPFLAWVASSAGGWHRSWAVTGACALAGMGMAAAIGRLLAHEFDSKGWRAAQRPAGHITGDIAK